MYLWQYFTLYNNNRDKQIARVVEIIPHPKFQYKKYGNNIGAHPIYDIVLLRMNPPLKLNERTQPIPLIPSDYQIHGKILNFYFKAF